MDLKTYPVSQKEKRGPIALYLFLAIIVISALIAFYFIVNQNSGYQQKSIPTCYSPRPIQDIQVWKIDLLGNEQWNTSIDTGNDDIVYSIYQADDGNYSIFGAIETTGTKNPDLGKYVSKFIKLNTSGRIISTKIYNSSPKSYVDDSILPPGKSYLLHKAPVGGYLAVNNKGIVLLDDNGNLRKTIEIPLPDILGAVIMTSDGGYAFIGSYQFDHPQKAAKFDQDGNLIWMVEYPNIPKDYLDILETSDYGYIIQGSRHGSLDFELIKLDTNGKRLWNISFANNMKDCRSFEKLKFSEPSSSNYEIITECLWKNWLTSENQWKIYSVNVDNGGIIGQINERKIPRSAISMPNGGYMNIDLPSKELSKRNNEGDIEWERKISGPNIWSYQIIKTNDKGYLIVASTDQALEKTSEKSC